MLSDRNPLDFTFVSPPDEGGPKLPVSPISSDETMWLAKIDFEDLQDLFDAPVKWVDRLNDQLPDEQKAKRPIQLEKHFLITYKGPEVAYEGDKSYLLVEGIVNTGLLTIRPKMKNPGPNFVGLTALALDGLADVPQVDIAELQRTSLTEVQDVDVTISEEFGLGFAHYQITSKGDALRAQKITAHLVALSHPGGFDTLMSTWDVTRTRRPDNSALTAVPAGFKVKLRSGIDTSNAHFIYEGSTDGADQVCSKVVGPIDAEGNMTPETVVVMDYSPPKEIPPGTGGSG